MIHAEQIRQQCLERGDAPALSFGPAREDTVSYAALGTCIDNLCTWLAPLAIVPGAVYGIVYQNALVHAVLILALERLGAATVTLQEMPAVPLNLAAIFSDRDLPAAKRPVHKVRGEWLRVAQAGEAGAPRPYAHSPGDICRIAFTSGSTGNPKAVALTYAAVAKGNAMQNFSMGEDFKRQTRRLCCVGINVAFGYRVLMRTLSEGGLFCYANSDLESCVKQLNRHWVQVLIGSPAQLVYFAGYGEKIAGSFPSLELVVCGGARLPTALGEKLRSHVCRRVLTSYGSSEGGYIAAGPAEKLDLEAGEVGYLIPGVEAQIVDEATRQPIAGGTGLLRLRGEDVIRGYYGESPGQDAHFDGEWFYPGDIASLSPEGLLTIVGRKDNVVSFGGVKTTLEAVEMQLSRAPGVRDVAAIAAATDAGFNQVVAFAVAAPGWSEKAFWDYCHARLEKGLWPAKLILLPEFPRLSSGKVDRQRLKTFVPA